MKSFMCLALIAVLCAVELSQAAAPTEFTLKVTDKNQQKQEERDTEFTCVFTTTEAITSVTIVKVDEPAAGQTFNLLTCDGTKTTFYKLEGKINAATSVAANTDFHKTTFSTKKAEAPAIAGNYRCDVIILGQTYPSPVVAVYDKSETAALVLATKDPADKEKPTEFKDDNTFEGSCAAVIPDLEQITKMEILSDAKVIATGDKEFAFTYPKPALEGFPEGAVTVTGDKAGKKATIAITKVNDKSAGKFKCRYNVEVTATPTIVKTEITSNEIPFTHINGAAANVASLTLLVLAVTSYIKLSL